jgi:hypothetical protein
LDHFRLEFLLSEPAAANVLASARFAAKIREKNRASVSHEELPRCPQILRKRWIIFGEFA